MRSLLLWTILGLLAGCVPDLPSETWRVAYPRVLAVTGSVAEARPGQKVTLRAFVATPDGPLAAGDPRGAQVTWDACSARLRLDEPGPVSSQCLVDGEHQKSLGSGVGVAWTVPTDVCRVFGPQPPAPKQGEPAGRPVDADATGGYHAPLRVLGPEAWVEPELARLRVLCGLAGATQADAARYTAQYLPNTAPGLLALTATLPDGSSRDLPLAAGAAVVPLPAGADVRLQTSWEACPELPADAAPKPCAGNEPYLVHDPARRVLEERREGRSVSWYVTSGALALPRTTVLPATTALTLHNTLRMPEAGRSLWLYLVVRDDRGGSTALAIALRAE